MEDQLTTSVETANEESGNRPPAPAACPQCGAPLGISWRKVDAAPEDVIPPGVRGWSWGAFLLNVIWAIGNRTWIGLLMFVPYVCFVMPFVLGFNGREWAWKNRRWESIEQFNRVQREWTQTGIGIACIIIVMAYISVPVYRDMTLSRKLIHVESAMEPVRAAVARVYRDQGSIPAMHTIITADNQGKPATPDWAALGFKELPALPPQVKRLEFSTLESPEIVAELDKIDETINGTTVRARLIVVEKQLSWQHEVTSNNPIVARVFHYADGIVKTPDTAARKGTCP